MKLREIEKGTTGWLL